MPTAHLHAVPAAETRLVELYAEAPLPTKHGLFCTLVFREKGTEKEHVVALKGDWTRQNPEITAFLQRFGRSGVPLYLLYDRAGAPTVLPQILTEAQLLAAIGKI